MEGDMARAVAVPSYLVLRFFNHAAFKYSKKAGGEGLAISDSYAVS